MLEVHLSGKVNFFLLSTDFALMAAMIGVNFYNAVARHYTVRRYWDISKAAEFSKWAFTLAQKTNDIDLQLAALKTEQSLAECSFNPHWIIKVVHKARSITGFRSTCHWEHYWLIGEACAHL
jgi:hypothetical protein